MNRAQLIREQTVIARVPLVSEFAMHLITEACPLWRGRERDAESLGLPLPYWAFCWPGGQALARFLLDHPEVVRGKRVLDFGSGCAIEALAAMRSGATHAIAADIDPFAAEVAALNAELAKLSIETTTENLIGRSGNWDVILAGDVFYDRKLVEEVMGWLGAESARGVTVLLGDPDRGWLKTGNLHLEASFTTAADGDVSGAVTKDAKVWRVANVL